MEAGGVEAVVPARKALISGRDAAGTGDDAHAETPSAKESLTTAIGREGRSGSCFQVRRSTIWVMVFRQTENSRASFLLFIPDACLSRIASTVSAESRRVLMPLLILRRPVFIEC